MKKRILSLILALSMVLSVLPLGAFAEGSSGDLIIGSDGYPVGSNGGKDSCSGNDWEYSNGALYLNLGAFNLSTTEPVKCEIHSFATITGGTFNGKVYNFGTISGGTFQQDVENHGTIKNGTFNGDVTNDSTIKNSIFAGSVTNGSNIEDCTFQGTYKVTNNSTITRGTFQNGYIVKNNDTISGGTFQNGCSVENKGTINGNGTFEGTVENNGIISDGTFKGGVINYKTISGGTFQNTCSVENHGTINGNGIFAGIVTNNNTISGGTFQSTSNVINANDGTISDGTFAGRVINHNTISGGAFQNGCSVTNYGTINGNGIFNGEVSNNAATATIESGTFNGKVSNNQGGKITNGTFEQEVINNAGGEISGGTFAGGVNNYDGHIFGGVFNGKTGLTDALQVTVTNDSVLKVNDEAPRNADGTTGTAWNLYSYEGTTMTITANTDIYSLNGQPIVDGNCNSSYPDTSKKTIVKFTMPNRNVELGTGELVMKGGFPVGSNNGADDCEGNGWEYRKINTSNPTGTLNLTSGEYDFSSTHPQGKTQGTQPAPAVQCAIEIQSGAKISGGTFERLVVNSGSIIEKGTFKQEVINNANGTISDGTFKGLVTNYNGRIANGTFMSDVANYNDGQILGGIFAAGLSKNDGKVTGGIFNGNKKLTNAHHVTVTNGSLLTVNGEDPWNSGGMWDLYSYKGTTVTITASTEIFSLNGQSIGTDYNSSYDGNKNTVKFTIPNEDVELNRTAELTVVDGEIKSGETAKGSGRVLIGGKVEVTTKDKTQDFVGWTIAPEGIELRYDDGSAVDLTSERTFSFVMPDVSGGKLTLKANYQPFRTSLLMNADGTVNLEHVDKIYDGNEICKGDGWNVINGGTLILENGTYDFRYTAPTEKTGTLEAVTCGVRNKGGTIENGVFRNLVLNEVGGTITGGTFAVGLFEMPGMTSGTVTGGVFNGKTGLTDAHHVTVTNGSVLKVNGEDPLKVDETTGAVTTGTAWDLYAYAGTTVTITADTDIFSLNGKPIGVGNCNSSYGSDKTIVTFTMPDKDVVLNEEINYGDLVMENGYPKASNGGTIPCKGDGWQYIPNDPNFGNMLLLTGSNQTGGLYDFSTIGDGSAVKCIVFVGKPTAITGGEFNGKVINNSHILGGTFNGEVDNRAPGIIKGGTFNGAVENNGIIEKGTFNGAVTGSGTVSESITGSGTLNGELITKTPEPKPEPEPTTYTVTVIGGTIDGKTSVSAKENDTLTVVLDQNDIPDGMTFDMWSISSSKLSGDINVDYRAESMTFQMPAEDVTIRAQYRSAEIIEDTAPSPLATAATVALGGAAAGIVVWQGVSLGVDLYLTSALPQGVPVPTDRRALALLLWETAGKPEVALPTLYGDVPAEEIELQKATHWAVQNGLMDAADKKDASFFDPDHYVTKMDVFGAWLRLKKLLGTT